MKNNINKQSKANNIEDTKEKKIIPKSAKDKSNKDKIKKDNQIINSNIDDRIQNLRNNAMEKIKLYTNSIDQRIKQINTESIFKPKKTNNYQPISSKSNNNNPFRNAIKDNINSRKYNKNGLSIKKLVNSNICSNSTMTIKENNLSKNKIKELPANNSEIYNLRNQKKDKYSFKSKYSYNNIENNKIYGSEVGSDLNKSKNNIIPIDRRVNEKNKYDINKNFDINKDNKNIIEIKNDKKENHFDFIEDIDTKKRNSSLGTDYYKGKKKQKLKMNGKNDYIIETESYQNKKENNIILNKKEEKKLQKEKIENYNNYIKIVKEDNKKLLNKNESKLNQENKENKELIINKDKNNEKNQNIRELKKDNIKNEEKENFKDKIDKNKEKIEKIIEEKTEKIENEINNKIIKKLEENNEIYIKEKKEQNHKKDELNKNKEENEKQINLIQSNDFKIVDDINDIEFNDSPNNNIQNNNIIDLDKQINNIKKENNNVLSKIKEIIKEENNENDENENFQLNVNIITNFNGKESKIIESNRKEKEKKNIIYSNNNQNKFEKREKIEKKDEKNIIKKDNINKHLYNENNGMDNKNNNHIEEKEIESDSINNFEDSLSNNNNNDKKNDSNNKISNNNSKNKDNINNNNNINNNMNKKINNFINILNNKINSINKNNNINRFNNISNTNSKNNVFNGNEKAFLNKEKNDINGNIKQEKVEDEDKRFFNDVKIKSKDIKNNGIEISNKFNNYENENKINELNSIQNKSKAKYDVIEIPVNESNKLRQKPKLKEKSIKNENTKSPISSKSMMAIQEINSNLHLLNNIQDLIIKSKQKIEKDLDKIEKKEKKEKQSNIPNKKKILSEDTKKKNSKKDIFKKFNDNKKQQESQISNKELRLPLNKRFDTDLNTNNKNSNQTKSRIKRIKRDNRINVSGSGYKNENEKFTKNISTQIKINNDYMNNYLDFSNNTYNIKNDEIANVSNVSPQNAYRESSQKINYRNTKFDDIDLNTFFTKSIKKEEKKYNKQISNSKYIEENGAIKLNENEKEEKIKTIKEEEEVSLEQEKIKFERKTELLKKIIISTELKHNHNNNKENSIKENEEEGIIEKEKDKNELININKDLINKITILKKEVEFSKNEMRRKDEKFLRYLDKFDKIASENAYNIAEIENLEEELINKENEMDMKTKKIYELMNKNIGLEKKMDQLKIYYQSKENSNKNLIDYNSKENEYIEKKNSKINEKEANDILYEDNNKKDQFEDLSLDELHSRRNALIKERNDITFLYNKLPIKLINKEQKKQKNEIENKLTKINNDLMKIRLQLKNYS